MLLNRGNGDALSHPSSSFESRAAVRESFGEAETLGKVAQLEKAVREKVQPNSLSRMVVNRFVVTMHLPSTSKNPKRCTLVSPRPLPHR